MDLDLEIINYSISQLEFFFKLEPNYTEEDITLKEDILKNKIIKIKELTDNASDGIFKKREYFGPIKLEKFKIRILNKYGEVINLKQNDFSFVLEIKQLY